MEQSPPHKIYQSPQAREAGTPLQCTIQGSGLSGACRNASRQHLYIHKVEPQCTYRMDDAAETLDSCSILGINKHIREMNRICEENTNFTP